jgi:ketosteroid isomerase-like protein
VRAFFRAVSHARPADLRELVTEDLTWWIPQSSADKSAARIGTAKGERSVQGWDAISRMLFGSGFYRDRRSSPEYDPMAYDFHQILVDGDHAVSHHTMKTVTAAGLDYQNEFVFVFRFRGGRIAEVWEHLDTAHSYASLGLNDPQPAG